MAANSTTSSSSTSEIEQLFLTACMQGNMQLAQKLWELHQMGVTTLPLRPAFRWACQGKHPENYQLDPLPYEPEPPEDTFERVFREACEAEDLVALQRLLESISTQRQPLNLVPIFRHACQWNLPLSELLLAKYPTLANSVCRHDYLAKIPEDEFIPWVKGTCCSSTTVNKMA